MVWQATSQEAEKIEFTSARREMSERIAMTQTEQEFHRKVAVGCFHKSWDLLNRKRRTRTGGGLGRRLAHSSRHPLWSAAAATHFSIGAVRNSPSCSRRSH